MLRRDACCAHCCFVDDDADRVVCNAGLLTVITRSYVHSIRCSAADAKALDASSAASVRVDTPPDIAMELVTFNLFGRKVYTPTRLSEIVWPEHDTGFFSSFSTAGKDFYVHDGVIKADDRLRRLFPALAAQVCTVLLLVN